MYALNASKSCYGVENWWIVSILKQHFPLGFAISEVFDLRTVLKSKIVIQKVKT